MTFYNCLNLVALKPVFMNILIVEDNKELAVEVYDFLCNAGYICKIANNCSDALKK